MIGYHVEREAIAPRRDLHIHTVGVRGDIVDESGYVRDAYGVSAGDWVLVRPDGYVGAIVSSGEIGELRRYMDDAGLVG